MYPSLQEILAAQRISYPFIILRNSTLGKLQLEENTRTFFIVLKNNTIKGYSRSGNILYNKFTGLHKIDIIREKNNT